MSNTVFILGAGASKGAGAPLMNDFLDVARELWVLNAVGKDSHIRFERVFDAISALQVVHSKAQLDLNNIESVFTTCEIAKTLGRFPGKKEDEIDELIQDLKVLITRTLELTIRFPVHHGQIIAPPPYGEFVALLRHLREKSNPRHKVTVLTFNYDIALDVALHRGAFLADYGLGEKTAVDTDPLPLLKLHGSLNWSDTRSDVVEKAVIPVPMSFFLNALRTGHMSPAKPVTIPVSDNLLKVAQQHSLPITGEIVLVPPTWNKADTHRTLSKVWKRAAQALSEAENIFVAGYSMPETDAFFRHLYALGTVGKTQLRRFWVFDPDTSGAVKDRFKALLGPGAESRFQYHELTFGKSIPHLLKTFP